MYWQCFFPIPGLGLQGPNSGTFFLYLLAIIELLLDEKYDDVDWLDVPWFGTLFNFFKMWHKRG